MSYKVTAADIGAVQLNETDTVRSVLQNIAIILSTRQGTCPLYRGFGLPQKFVGKPMPVAMSMMYSEVKEAVEEYEPRADVVNVTFEVNEAALGRLIPTVEVNIINE